MTQPATPVVPLLRVLLAAGAVFVLAAGTQLYLLASHTDRYFAWTIANPFTATALGAFYLGAVVIAGWSARHSEWALARAGVTGILVFVWLTLAASLIHISVMHLRTPALVPRLAAWAWLAIYVADPPLLLLALVMQLRRRHGDPPRGAPAPDWYRRTCSALAVPVLVIGVAEVVRPAGGVSAWPLTPIASQTLGAWFIALAVLLVSVAIEADWQRVRPATAGMVVLAVLQLIAVLRYPHATQGFGAAWWICLWVILLVLGGYALVQAQVASNREPRET